MERRNNQTMGSRRKARILALQVLYEMDSSRHPYPEIMERALSKNSIDIRGGEFTKTLVDGVIQKLPEIDKRIEKFATVWPVDQLSIIDRNILRIAIFEVVVYNRTPIKAAVNEAVELAKGFGGESSPQFINGVLGSILGRARTQELP